MIALLLLSTFGHAQDGGVDAHNFRPLPGDGDLSDLMMTWRPEAQAAGAFSASLLGEYAHEPLVRYHQAGDAVTRNALLDSVIAFDVGAAFAVHERVGLGVAVPVFARSVGPDGAEGLAAGDVRLSAPIGILLPDGAGFGLSVVPQATLPVGADARYLGSAGATGGAALAAGWTDGGPLTLAANAGFEVAPKVDLMNLTGGPRLHTSLGGALRVDDHHAVRLEGVLASPLQSSEIPGTQAPAELYLSGVGRYDSGLRWTGGVSGGVSQGAGAATYRVFAGAGWVFGKDVAPLGDAVIDRDGDGFADPDDTCPTEPEAWNGWRDDDGCPDELADVAVRVVGGGGPLAAADVVVGEPAQTRDDGSVTVGGLVPEQEVAVSASAPGYEVGHGRVVPRDGETAEVVVALEPKHGHLAVTARGRDGAPVDAEVRLDGPEDRVERIGADGEGLLALPPGEWTVTVTAPNHGAQSRRVEVGPGGEVSTAFELVPAKVEVTKDEIRILDKVFFDFDTADLRPESEPLLSEVAATLLSNPQVRKVEIQGHTSDEGEADYNRELSQRRAARILAFLTDAGVDAERLVAKGYGEDQPLVDNATEANRARNRRVQFVILEQDTVTIEVDADKVE